MAAPSIRAFTSNVTTTNNLSLDRPTGTASGDLLLAMLFPVGPPDANKTVTPSDGGFTEIAAASTFVNDGAWRGNLRVFRKPAGGSEPSSYTFTTANIDHFAGVLVSIQGALTSADPAAVQAAVEDAASLVLSGLTASQNESLILVAQIGWDTLGDAALPVASGLTFTEHFDNAGNDIAFATAVKATAGAVGNISITSSDFRFCALAIAIEPAAGGSTQTVNPTAITSAEAFGTLTVQPGAVTVSPTAISSAETFGSPTIQPGAVTVSPDSVASAEAFGSPTIQSGASIITPDGIASGETFGTPTIAATYTISPSAIVSGEAFGTPTVAVTYSINPTAIASLETFGSPTITTSYTISPDGIASGETFGTPAIARAGVVAVTSIASAEAFGTPAIVAGPVTVAPDSISPAEAFGAPTLTASYTITAQGVDSAEAFGNPAVNLMLAILLPSSIASGDAFGAITILGGGSPLALAVDNRTLNVSWIDNQAIPTGWIDDRSFKLE